MVLRTEANGVMPIPAPTRTATAGSAISQRSTEESEELQRCTLVAEDVLRRRAERPVDADGRERTSCVERSGSHVMEIAGTVDGFEVCRRRVELHLLGRAERSRAASGGSPVAAEKLAESADNQGRGERSHLRPQGAKGHSPSPVADLADVHRGVRVIRRRRDREWVPLERRDGRNVEEEPLARLVSERRLDEAEFERALGMEEDGDELGRAAAADLHERRTPRLTSASVGEPHRLTRGVASCLTHLADNAFEEQRNATPDGPRPRIVAEAANGLAGKGAPDEAADGVNVEAEEDERDLQELGDQLI